MAMSGITGSHEDDEPETGAHAGVPDDVIDLSAELELGDDDERLPWLEADDEDDDYNSGKGQIAALLLIGCGALGLILGTIWWFTRDTSDGTHVADGSVIAAPDTPYKEKPKDHGGKTFQGTGDTSFAVSEGETRPVQLGSDEPAPKPGFETVGTDAIAKPAADNAAAPTGPVVQVGAYFTRARANQAWRDLSRKYSALKGQRHRVIEGKADIGTVFRLQVLTGNIDAARGLCGQLKAAGADCSVKS